ncbi:MAG: trehalose-6-phosphate synthase [Deltaproteobacteria bacterium]|nr:trehalose-6-phosphate synthase [Deltaproteobacteria bacterium]
MRSALRLLLPLLLVLALVAWGAAEVSSRSARAWAEKDLGARARLVLTGVHEQLAGRLASGERRRARDLLEDLARDERLVAAALCDGAQRTFAATAAMPDALGCGVWQELGADGLEVTREVAGGTVHVSLLPISEGPERGWLVLIHDLSWVSRRAESTRRALFFAFGLVGALAAVVTVLVARFARRSWTEELRRLLPAMLGGGPGPPPQPANDFKPVLADVRELVTRLAAEEVAGSGGRWSAERLRQVLRRNLQGEGVLVVANREPCVHQRQPDGSVRALFPASGLVTAIEPVMRACSGTWIAHGSGSADRETADRNGRLLVPPGEGAYTLRRVWLTEEQERGYYYGFSNEGLWPLCHLAHARPEWRVADWEQYERVNRIFAEAVVSEAETPDPIVLVQDYHFALLPQILREALPRATILTFWHIPWPNAERFGICPWEQRLLQGLLGSSILGFHTQAHCNNFLDSVDRYLEARIDRERHSVVMGGRETLVRPYPISVDWPSRWMASVPPVAECRASLRQELGLPPEALLGVGVDRLDYTKGIVERFQAVERMLERFPQYVGRFTFVQLAAPSRTLIPRYQELNDEVERIAARVNERFGSGSYRPIVLHLSHHEPPEVFRAYRAADLCYVSSIHDGMNLVAKEFVSARDDLAGVLVLSRFTGAARELTEALVVNPYDLEAASAAMAAALAMPRAEQQERMRALRGLVAEFNVYRWAGRMLLDATRLRQRDRLSARLGADPGPEEAPGP